MKFMVVWKTVPGHYKTAMDQFYGRAAQCRRGRRLWAVLDGTGVRGQRARLRVPAASQRVARGFPRCRSAKSR